MLGFKNFQAITLLREELIPLAWTDSLIFIKESGRFWQMEEEDEESGCRGS